MSHYIKPRSITFWAGIFMIAEGVAVASEPLHGLADLSATINAMTGNAGAATLINMGLGLIGLRRAIGK